MTLLRGLVGVLVGLAVSVGFVQFLELMLANALAGRALQSMDDYALVLNTLPMLGIRLVVSSFMALLGGYVCAKLAEHDESRKAPIRSDVGGGIVDHSFEKMPVQGAP